MKKRLLDVIIPTYNHPDMLMSCIHSLDTSLGLLSQEVNIVVVNNGEKDACKDLELTEYKHVLSPGRNLGWTGGLAYAVERTESPFLMFLNDDTRMVPANIGTVYGLLTGFNSKIVGAVGPCSNYVMGWQNMFLNVRAHVLDVPFLIGFCMLVRREALEKAGGIDPAFYYGDDIDLSIRLRDAGYKLLADRREFVFHHGEVTGVAVHGRNSWNHPTQIERTYRHLIKKHGMMKFWETIVTGLMVPRAYCSRDYAATDMEGDLCREWIAGDKIVDLGCGKAKTVPNAVGIDRIPGLCDIRGDVTKPLPFEPGSQDTIIARHIFEHCLDPIGTLENWAAALKVGGRLIIACPNEELGNTIMMNREHVAAYTPAALTRIVELCGFKIIYTNPNTNGTSFVLVLEKLPVKENKEVDSWIKEPILSA